MLQSLKTHENSNFLPPPFTARYMQCADEWFKKIQFFRSSIFLLWFVNKLEYLLGKHLELDLNLLG
jgi:hypothetical protein